MARTEQLAVRFSSAERHRLEEAASLEGLPPTTVLRRLGMDWTYGRLERAVVNQADVVSLARKECEP